MTSRHKIFESATKKLARMMHKLFWRPLYSATYDLVQHHKLSDTDVAIRMSTIGLLYPARSGKRTKDNARRIMYAMILAILENNDTDSVRYFNVLNTTERVEFANRTMQRAHSHISHELPQIAPYFHTIRIGDNMPDETYAYYRQYNAEISLNPVLLEKSDFKEFTSFLAHEYVHAMQAAFVSSLPLPILNIDSCRFDATQKIPYLLDPLEREAFRIGHLVSHNFNRYFENKVIEYQNTGTITGYPTNER